MHMQYEPAAALVDQLLSDHVVPRIWARDVATWRAARGSADATSIATRLGWLDVGETMAPHIAKLQAEHSWAALAASTVDLVNELAPKRGWV